MNRSQRLIELYHLLLNHFGPQGWWPAKTSFEVCVGAILTQNTNWQNVEKAIANLRRQDLLDPEALWRVPTDHLAHLIRPAGYYNLKARRLKNFLEFVMEGWQGDLEAMFAEGLSLRPRLLAVSGIGPETADSILLYAGHLPIFVVDAYTKRILHRHLLVPEEAGYQEIQDFFMENLPEDVQLYQEYHALLVALGKNFCLKGRPRCPQCPAKGW
ncbi:endonuclease III domain-containing protein [Thermosulfuriphilus ammonigenes]|uniref:Endonuclease III domain-containing protein n=1 Tax=Thermosulfuriphilus ammonigenes TaxID=1936021 RepID=A0A6G7PYY0_9BACT|nr:endonuclease III domain-containing protein [Thermosulfuriphilus ammonigenes]MBA2849107.1 endonuclease-3 related protein [Thermosulfuriphilus ammonigenes]QIJ72787.1 endonuclease III domain-containing protein [Thermosulfuriphilus ammonigenes]